MYFLKLCFWNHRCIWLINSVCVCSVIQSCLTLCHPLDCSPTGSSLHGIFQARILEWVAICYSMGSSPPRDRTCIWFSCISCIWQAVSLPLHHLGNPLNKLVTDKKILTEWFFRAFISAKWRTSKADCFLTKVSIHFQWQGEVLGSIPYQGYKLSLF